MTPQFGITWSIIRHFLYSCFTFLLSFMGLSTGAQAFRQNVSPYFVVKPSSMSTSARDFAASEFHLHIAKARKIFLLAVVIKIKL